MRSALVRSAAVALVFAVLLVPLTACGGSAPDTGVVTGSSAQTTKTYNLSGFTALQVDQQFSVEVKRGDAYAVSVGVNENLVQYLKVEVQGDTLHIGLDPGKKYRVAALTAEVTLPELTGVAVAGASEVYVETFSSRKPLTLQVSGAGKLALASVRAKEATVDVSGGSGLGGELRVTGDLDLTAAGASRAVLTGSARDVRLAASGAAVVSLKGVSARNVQVELSEASQASVRAVGTIDLQASGASVLDYYGRGKLGAVDVSGASQINHIQ